MSDHVIELLGAYLDGELSNGQFRKVVSHLDICQACREEYQAMRALSATLHAAPLPVFPSAERLAADIVLRLPRKPVKPISRRALEIGWWLAPVGLIVVWIFISTTILISNVLTTASNFGLLSDASAWLAAGSTGANYSAFLGQLGLLAGNSLEWAEMTEAFTRTNVSQIFWQVSIALLYLSWLAIWWARHPRQGLGQPLES